MTGPPRPGPPAVVSDPSGVDGVFLETKIWISVDLTGGRLAAIDALDTGRRRGPEPTATTLANVGCPVPEN